LQHQKKRRDLRDRKVAVFDRLDLWWFSTGRNIDGLWVGTIEKDPWPGLRRVEEALQLIKDHDTLHYSRVINNLERIWVRLLTDGFAQYQRSLNACVFDERSVVKETTPIERIASTIVHEATHARLDRWGVIYEENKRVRIEAICMRREQHFLARLPQSERFRETIARNMEWFAGNDDFFSSASFQQRRLEGQIEALRHLGVPEWLIRSLLNGRAALRWVAGRVRRQA